ncbi:hypothetical protein RSK60_1520038 [Ralstonia solanacearum K60]|nr:hypothetical protein RSK60_1520038 [Ralstonia solanacearum K60]
MVGSLNLFMYDPMGVPSFRALRRFRRTVPVIGEGTHEKNDCQPDAGIQHHRPPGHRKGRTVNQGGMDPD